MTTKAMGLCVVALLSACAGEGNDPGGGTCETQDGNCEAYCSYMEQCGAPDEDVAVCPAQCEQAAQESADAGCSAQFNCTYACYLESDCGTTIASCNDETDAWLTCLAGGA